jgi:hypothetical protein
MKIVEFMDFQPLALKVFRIETVQQDQVRWWIMGQDGVTVAVLKRGQGPQGSDAFDPCFIDADDRRVFDHVNDLKVVDLGVGAGYVAHGQTRKQIVVQMKAGEDFAVRTDESVVWSRIPGDVEQALEVWKMVLC